MANELIIRFTTQPGTVDENIAQVSKQVDEWLAEFKGMADVSDDAKADLDDKLRQLRAGHKTIDDERKRIKKAYLAPLEQFESKVKPITEKIDQAIAIGKQRSDEIQAKADAKKRAEIEKWWDANRPRGILISLDLVWDKRYLNKTGLGVTWRQDLQGKISRINREEDAIVSLIMEDHAKGDFVSTDYAQHLDLPGALSRWEQHQQAMKASDEIRLAARGRETRQNADFEPIQPQVQKDEEVSAPVEDRQTAGRQPSHDGNEATYWADFTIEQARLHIDHATLEQMKSLTLALNEAFGTDWHVARDENGNPRKGH